jgi:hypothetical protein
LPANHGRTAKKQWTRSCGIGKVAEAIPKAVFERSAETLLTTFEKLTAPITESTSGFGRYLRQKFNNMVEVEKALATYALEEAIARASRRCEKAKIGLKSPAHPKTFVRTIEEASRETNPILHEMWTNLLSSQLSSEASHPHFVEVLSHFSPADAKLLVSLYPESEIGKHNTYIAINPGFGVAWVRRNSDAEIHPWTTSCDMLYEFRFIHVAAEPPVNRNVAILYRTHLGSEFLATVRDPS